MGRAEPCGTTGARLRAVKGGSRGGSRFGWRDAGDDALFVQLFRFATLEVALPTAEDRRLALCVRLAD